MNEGRWVIIGWQRLHKDSALQIWEVQLVCEEFEAEGKAKTRHLPISSVYGGHLADEAVIISYVIFWAQHNHVLSVEEL